MTNRPPQRNGGFSWGRFIDDYSITYRLFRRDHRGALHLKCLTYGLHVTRATIAADLMRAKRQLRDRVDEIDLQAMGVAQ